MKIRVHYPVKNGRMLLRTDEDWELDLMPRKQGGGSFEFELDDERPFRYFKPLLSDEDGLRWSQGTNYLAVAGRRTPDVFPYFQPDASCHVCDLHHVPSCFEDRGYQVRVFLPPGYDENELERFPVLYMQDGQNLFFPDEAFGGKHWRVQETLALLNSMSLVRQVIVVGIYARDRMQEYTDPGYHGYAAFLADELKPWVDSNYRTLQGPRHSAVLGSSLGGVVSLHTAWEHSTAFGNVGCMSSTFGYGDDLLERVLAGTKRPIRVYLDTGWPGDNFEVNRAMREALALCGYLEGRDLLYIAFPEAAHDEDSWAHRLHVPLQFFFEATRRVVDPPGLRSSRAT